jgi:hypothetical protein
MAPAAAAAGARKAKQTAPEQLAQAREQSVLPVGDAALVTRLIRDCCATDGYIAAFTVPARIRIESAGPLQPVAMAAVLAAGTTRPPVMGAADPAVAASGPPAAAATAAPAGSMDCDSAGDASGFGR